MDRICKRLVNDVCIDEAEPLLAKTLLKTLHRLREAIGLVTDETKLSSTHRQQLLFAAVALSRRLVLCDERATLSPLVGMLFLILVNGSPELAAVKSRKEAMEREHELRLVAREAERGRRRQRQRARAEAGEEKELVEVFTADIMSEDEVTDEVTDETEETEETVEEPPTALQAWYTRSIGDEMRAVEHDFDESQALAPSAVAQLCLREAADTSLDADMLETLGQLFAQQSAAAVAAALLRAPPHTVALEALPNLDDATRQKYLLNIVSAAESETGQVYYRELLSSFNLPRNVVGLRRTLMLSRSTNEMAALKHADVVHESHCKAMLGAEYGYALPMEESRKWATELIQTSALLAGAAMLLRKSDDCPRTSTAFRGRISLPFLELPQPRGRRIHYLQATHTWVLARHGANCLLLDPLQTLKSRPKIHAPWLESRFDASWLELPTMSSRFVSIGPLSRRRFAWARGHSHSPLEEVESMGVTIVIL